jgi:hypothetical protein
MAFDPDKYLAAPSGGFDPDAYLSGKPSKPKLEQIDINGPQKMPMFSVDGTLDAVKNLGMGSIRGAERIGKTLLRPVSPMVAGSAPFGGDIEPMRGNASPENQSRDQSVQQFFNENADPNSVPFKVGDLTTQIAGTAGVAGMLGKAASAAPATAKYAQLLQSGGFKMGNAGTNSAIVNALMRGGAGATVGGTSTGMIDPESATTGALIGGALPGAVKVAGMSGRGLKSLGEHILGTTTGTSAEAVKTAFKAGKSGSTEFLKNMRGEVPFDDIVARAKDGLIKMRVERSQAYRSGMVDIKADKSVLDMSPIVKSVREIQSSGNFKGKVINEKASGTIKEIADKVDDWAKSAADDFHTPEGLDALKQSIGDIRDSTQFGTPARRAADAVYNSIKDQIKKQAPGYEKVMRDYSVASSELQEIEKALSLGSKASKDTATRKLQSLMRNNANTNYGSRMDLAKVLADKGGANLDNAIAGQAMSSWTPRGLQKLVAGGGAPAMALMGEPVSGALLAAASSPRLIGEAAYGAGRAIGAPSNAIASALRNQLPAGANGQIGEAVMANPVLRNAIVQMLAR